jgi:hypothetical protein
LNENNLICLQTIPSGQMVRNAGVLRAINWLRMQLANFYFSCFFTEAGGILGT